MADDQTAIESAAGRRSRARHQESSARATALERLRSIRRGEGRKSENLKVKLDEPIYDTVSEEDYAALVAARRESARGFIVDDVEGGLGYLDEGEEDDWDCPSSSEGGESDVEERPKKKKPTVKRDPAPPKPTSLSAAAAMMGKQRLSEMFTSSVFKKGIRGSAASESIVDDVIAEFAPDETDRERRRRGKCSGTVRVESERKPLYVNIASKFVPLPNGTALKSAPTVAVSETPNMDVVEGNGIELGETVVSDEAPEVKSSMGDKGGNGGSTNVVESGMVELNVETVKKEKSFSLNAKLEAEGSVALASASAALEDVWKGQDCKSSDCGVGAIKSNDDDVGKLEFDLESDGSLPFYIIDAHEEFYGANSGTLYLFGKVKSGDSYFSCCVVVKNIQRCVYAVPSGSVFPNDDIMELERSVSDSTISATAFRMKLHEMASGLKNEIAQKFMDLNVSKFSMTPVKRGYAFERSDIPIGEQYVLKINYPFKVSWCKYEVTVDCSKDVHLLSSKAPLEIPPVTVAAINLKTIINANVNEIVSASIICCQKAKIDSPMMASEWKRPGVLSHFTVVRKLDGGIFPMGFSKEASDRNSKAGSNILGLEGRHARNVPSSVWSKIGRLKRSIMPKLTKGNTLFGSGASPGIMTCIAGRLLCDTYLCSRDLLKEVSYSLTQLSKTQLNKERKEIAPHDIPNMFQSSGSLLELVGYGETDAWLSLELMFHLSILPLTRQLTNISGNLWGRTLQGARAQRVEYLLLHAFHAKKYIVPDKISAREKEAKTSKRRMNLGSDGGDGENGYINDVPLDDDAQNVERGKGKKGPAYAGGLVLEPKKGLYDKFILLLDFNSLYPSIIQEYNICFTTVERSSDGLAPSLPSCKTIGVLPELLRNLVERRKMVKSWLKTASGLKAQQLDIQQQALKLTANSMYGCLGFSNSRFYAKPLAELITLQVIYGDTDSIMIHSGLDDMAKAKPIAGKVIQEVNKKYRCLEIDLDGLYKRMLLLKKKKYAAVKVQFKDGKPYEVIERKGLDMVRRDWSLLSKEIGDFCLGQILSGGTCEDVVESIHSSLMKVQEEMRNGKVTLEKYVITKSLTKPPQDYPDAKNQPHVQVALRLKQSGYTTGCNAGDTVPYVICCQQGSGSVSTGGIAQRARHPDELKKDNENWMIDIEYYLSQQVFVIFTGFVSPNWYMFSYNFSVKIHPVVSRLCASIQGTSPARLADCLGLDSSKYQQNTAEAVSKDPSTALLCVLDDEERYRGCEPLWLSCPSCSGTFECPTINSFISDLSSGCLTDSSVEEVSRSDFWRRMRCPRCPEEGDVGRILPVMLANQVKRQSDSFILMYYKGLMKYTEVDLYKQLTYFCYVLDASRCIEKVDPIHRTTLEKELVRVRPIVDLAASTIRKIRDRCAYGWVHLKDLTVTV
ncbi:DNA polymerase alpha catalytic subunit [Acorus calamus]|uniref:DNA polymerase n=1 Tax=Acorus calamus TaxID=4465 RepID=A0AAV9DGJ3_ACOCL|nr:DNA polymerase alpha catalytic subunit [Acorus calamus]